MRLYLTSTQDEHQGLSPSRSATMTENSTPPIVVGIDGSSQSLAALRWALREGAQSGAPVHVVHCWQPQNLTEYALVAPHSFARASACMLDNEIAAALAE